MWNPCLVLPFSSYAYCNESLSVERRVEDMIGRMNLSEKISQLGSSSPGVPSLGLDEYVWWSEATHGISRVNNTGKTRYESNFAFPITTAMSFNRSLWRATGSQIGREARAFANEGTAYSTFWAPVVNLAREPRWGRNIETPGEDPYLSGQYAVEFVRGMEQSDEDGGARIQASACCKHYVANSMEHSTVAGTKMNRHDFDAIVDPMDLFDSYLPPFRTCVEEGRVSGLMCSYNSVNGIPSCANDWLLSSLARDQWEFQGYVTSDCDADEDVFDMHNFTSSPEEAVRDVLKAGTDLDCGSFVPQHAAEAIRQGLLTEKVIDERLANLFRVRLRLGHFDTSPSPLDLFRYDTDVCTDQAKGIARDGVAQSCALLKNTGKTLPLSSSSVGLIGPASRLAQTVALYYGGPPCNNKYTTLLDALEEEVTTVHFAAGVSSVASDDLGGISAALDVVNDAEVIIMALGTDLTLAREGMDAVNITLSDGQSALASAVMSAARNQSKTVVAVLFTATPLDISWLLSPEGPDAVLHVGQPSVQTHGILDVLFGRQSPAGRLVQTWYSSSYQSMISIFDMNLRPGPSAWPRPDCPAPYDNCTNGTNPGRTYRFYTGIPVLPFGFGLSYSSFRYDLAAAPTSMSVGINVTNTGEVQADDVVLAFVSPPGAGINGAPLKSLFGFERVRLLPGTTATLWFSPPEMIHEVDGDHRFTFGLHETQSYGMGYLDAGLVRFDAKSK